MNINNSVITFKKEGDIKIKAGRHFINEYDLGFNNCPAHFIEKATIAYSLGNEEYQKFLDKNEQENLPTVEREKCQC